VCYRTLLIAKWEKSMRPLLNISKNRKEKKMERREKEQA
jgi:hypothetical protein